jgi:hypothetical protein
MYLKYLLALTLATFQVVAVSGSQVISGDTLTGVTPPEEEEGESSTTLCTDAGANARYVKTASSGTGSGTSWTNAMAFPASPTRNLTYCLADGSYGNKTLSTVTSGTQTIKIVKATTTDHGATANGGDNGWVSTMGDGQAAFGQITCTTNYWILSGQTRTESHTWAAPAGYGFYASGIESDSSAGGADCSHSSFSYIDIGPAYSTTNGGPYGYPLKLTYNQQDITFSRCALHNGDGALFQGAGADNMTFEYCNIGPGWGKEALRGGNGSVSSGWTVRYNRFWNSSQTDPHDGTSGITAEIGSWDYTGACSGWQIYGNWFFNQFSGGRNALIVVGGDSGGWSGSNGTDGCDGTVVYNNTVAGIAEAAVFSMITLNGTSTVLRNTLWCQSVDTDTTADTTSDNDICSGTSIFVDYANRDYRLSGATGAGFTLGSPFNLDVLGVMRGGDGTWDVGAYEYTP